MKPLPFLRRALVLTLACLAAAAPARAADATTQVLKWKDGKKAVFFLGFDDSAPSQLKNAIPELEKRKIPGTFYLVTGHSLWAATHTKWEEAAKSPYVVVANHTFTHKGVNSLEELGPQLAQCNEVLYKLNPERKLPRLLAFGRPGGVPWAVSEEEQNAELAKNHLINRPPFAGPPINYHSAEEACAVVDKALARGDLGYFVFHGVGGDWLVTPMEWFTAILDKLEANRDQLWLTDTLSWHKYAKERESAEVKTLENSAERVRLELTSKMDPALYDEPLTLQTKVPPAWKSALVAQGATKVTVPAKDGAVQYDATPGAGEINLQPAP